MVSTNRILRVWPFWPEGLKYHDQHLAEAMAKDGVETMFACPRYMDRTYSPYTNDSSTGNEPTSYSVYSLKYLNIFGKPVPYNGLSFIRRIKEFNPSVVHIFGLSNFTTYFTLLCLRILRFKGKVLFNDHSDPTEKKSSLIARIYYVLFKTLYHLFIRNRYPVVVPDAGSQQELISRYGKSIKSVLTLIPLGFDEESFNLSYGRRLNAPPLVIGFAGKISPAKRVEILLEAIGDLCEKDFEVHICGFARSPNEYQTSLIKEIHASKFKNIKVYDFLNSSTDLANFYGAVDVAIFPGSISITTFEANGTGCPVVLYQSLPGLEHRVSGGRGYLFSQVEELKTHIQSYAALKNEVGIDHDEIYRSSRRYSWEILKEDYYRLYEWSITPLKHSDGPSDQYVDFFEHN